MHEMKRKIAIWCLTVAATVAIAGKDAAIRAIARGQGVDLEPDV